MVEETSFPRGSSRPAKEVSATESDSKKLRPSQKRKSSLGGDASSGLPTASSIKKDLLFGSNKKKEDRKSSSSSKKRKTEDTSATSSNTNSLMSLGGGGVVSKTKKHTKQGDGIASVSTTTYIEALGFSKVAKGSKLLACVREVHENYAIVSLPNLLTAYVLPQTVESGEPKYPLANTMHVGQTLAVVVTNIAQEQLKGGQSRKRIQVSALPQDVNPRLLLAGEAGGNNDSSITSAANRLARASVPIRGQIMSVEDHGCVIKLGFGKRGFLPFDKVGGDKDSNYIILEEDEDYEDEEDDDLSKRPIILQKGRVFDFLTVPVTTSSSKNQSATTVFPLSLPTTQKMAKQTVSSLTGSGSSKGGKRGNNKSTIIPFSFSSLTPGWLVQVKVEAVASNGLCVSLFGNVFRGAMEMNHLGATLIPDDKEGSASTSGRDGPFKKLAASLFQEHQYFAARILAVDVPTKLVRLSMAPHILTLSNPGEAKNPLQGFPTVGTVVSDCTVVKMDPGIGALLALPPQYNIETTSLLPKSLTKSCDLFQNASFQDAIHIRKVYVHISKALDESEEADADNDASITGKFLKEFAPSTKHSVRILSTGHWLDGIASGGCASHIIKAPVLTHDDLVPGQVFKQVPVCGHLPGGSVLVRLGGGKGRSGKGKKNKSSSSSHRIAGLIPPPQLFDVVTNESSEYRQRVFKTKYAIDAKVDVRVLWVDPLRKKCLVSAKKTLVQAVPENIITNYADAKVGQLAVGFVSKVDDQGLWITFCNKVYGKVTARSLAAELGVEDHRENYSVGDVVTSRVVKLKKVAQKGTTFENDDDDDMDIDDDEHEAQMQSSKEYWQLILSLKVHKNQGEGNQMDEEEVDVSDPRQVRLLAGAVLPAKSMKIVQLVNGKTKKYSGYVPGYAMVSIKSKYLVDGESLGKSKMLSYVECKLPYNNLVDSFEPVDIQNVESLDALAKRVLTVGKKIKQKGLVLMDPRKSIVDYASGIGTMPVVSLRKTLIQSREEQCNSKEMDPNKLPIVPFPDTNLFVGASLLGFVAQIDKRHGAFIRFLDGMTGMVPIRSGGLSLYLYDTVVTKVMVIDDSVRPHRILLEPVSATKQQNGSTLKAGDIISKATLCNIGFEYASLTTGPNKQRVFIHSADKKSKPSVIKRVKKPLQSSGRRHEILKCHPFYGLEKGEQLENLTVVSVQKNKIWVAEKDIDKENLDDMPGFIRETSQIKPGTKVNGIIVGYGKEKSGIFVDIGPKVTGFVSGLELSRDVKLLNNLEANVPLGTVIECIVIRAQAKRSSGDPFLILSVLACESGSATIPKPSDGDIVVGRINKSLDPVLAPSLMLDLRQGIARCCITELDEPDEWENMPLGQIKKETTSINDDNDMVDEEEEEEETAEVTEDEE